MRGRLDINNHSPDDCLAIEHDRCAPRASVGSTEAERRDGLTEGPVGQQWELEALRSGEPAILEPRIGTHARHAGTKRTERLQRALNVPQLLASAVSECLGEEREYPWCAQVVRKPDDIAI